MPDDRTARRARGAARALAATLLACAGTLPATQAHAQDRGPRYDYIGLRAMGGYSRFDNLANTGSKPGEVQKTNENDIVGGVGAYLGFDWRKFSPNATFRTEIEYGHDFRFDFNSRLLKTSPGTGTENNIANDVVLFNIYYDIPINQRWVPYIVAGVGASWVTADSNQTNFATGRGDHKTRTVSSFAYSFGLGTAYNFNEHWSATAGYRYVDLGRLTMGPFSDGTEVTTTHYVKHELALGLSYWF